MKKAEYIHLHALFEEVCRYLGERDGFSDDILGPSESRCVTASQIHHNKSKHHDSLGLLADCIVLAIVHHDRGPDGFREGHVRDADLR